jgi:type II secretory ATPase GspE/PulE/Tfp pilus assembly ATPase PilB-like protein
VLAQRLVRRVCDACATDVTYAPVPHQIPGLESIAERRWRRGNGCGRCDGTGYFGRLAVGELVQIDAELGTLIQDGAGESAIRSALSRRDIPDLPTAALISAARGLTSPEDAAALEEP